MQPINRAYIDPLRRPRDAGTEDWADEAYERDDAA
jgi:hypothetical protein